MGNDDGNSGDTGVVRGPMTTLPAYDEAVARYLAEMNAAAYACGSYEGCGQWACTSCLRHPRMEVLRFASDDTSTSGFVGYDPDEGRIVVAYAGTQPGDIEAWYVRKWMGGGRRRVCSFHKLHLYPTAYAQQVWERQWGARRLPKMRGLPDSCRL